MGSTMTKPFDLAAAKAGAPVQTRDGRKVRLLCFDRIDPNRYESVCGLVLYGDVEQYGSWNTHGEWGLARESMHDLVMAPVKRSRVEWVNVYRDGSNGHPNKGTADRQAAGGRLACIPVTLEWEE
jgi:hypothetical protein